MPQKEILVSITTKVKHKIKSKIRECNELGIEKIALFPTCLRPEARREFYKELERSGIKEIPFMHLRDDLERWELEFFQDRFKTRIFNTHPWQSSLEFIRKFSDYSDAIYLENQEEIDSVMHEGLKNCAGICLDLSHWEDFGFRENFPGYDGFPDLIKKYRIGCCHISAVCQEKYIYRSKSNGKEYFLFACHDMKDLSELDYVKKYKKYLPDVIAIELNNSIREQLRAKEYIEKMLASHNA